MLGWHIYIHRSPGGLSKDLAVKEASVVASWEVGLGGIDWLLALTKAGKAVQTAYNGYPMTFIAAAGTIRAALEAGLPRRDNDPIVIGDDYVAPCGWMSDVNIDRAKLAGCDSQEQLIVDAWDLS